MTDINGTACLSRVFLFSGSLTVDLITKKLEARRPKPMEVSTSVCLLHFRSFLPITTHHSSSFLSCQQKLGQESWDKKVDSRH